MEDYKLTEEDFTHLKKYLSSNYSTIDSKISSKIFKATCKGYDQYFNTLKQHRNPKLLYKYRKEFLSTLADIYLKNGESWSESLLLSSGRFLTEAYMKVVDPKFYTVVVSSYAPTIDFFESPDFSAFIYFSTKSRNGKFYTEIHTPEEELDRVVSLLEKYYLCHTEFKSTDDQFIYNWRPKLCLNLENL